MQAVESEKRRGKEGRLHNVGASQNTQLLKHGRRAFAHEMMYTKVP